MICCPVLLDKGFLTSNSYLFTFDTWLIMRERTKFKEFLRYIMKYSISLCVWIGCLFVDDSVFLPFWKG
jgi:hypothetical protein